MARLVEDWQVKLDQIDEFNVEGPFGRCDIKEPSSDGGSDATRARTSDDDL
jgi:hypothetical protein